MKQLVLTLSALTLLLYILPAQRSFQEKTQRDASQVLTPQLPYLQFDGRQSVPKQSPYQGLRGNLSLYRAASQHSGIEILGRDEKGLPIFLQTQPAAAKKYPTELEPATLLFLDEIAKVIGVKQPSQEFQVRAVQGRTVRLSQAWQGVPIWGADIAVNFLQNGRIQLSGRYQPSLEQLDIAPSVTEQEAIEAALKKVGEQTPVRYLRPIERKILKYPEHSADLMIYEGAETNGEPRLVYYLDLRPNFMMRWAVFVDAQSGEVVRDYDHTCTVGPVNGSSRDLNNVSQNFSVYDAGNSQFALVDISQPMFTGSNANPDLGDGIILTADMNNTTLNNPQFNDITSTSANSWNATAVSAHVNAITSYDYFKNTHSRSSINGSGGDIVSFINVADDDGGGLDNAFWNGQYIFYGSGRSLFKPLAGALDVAAHEMSHGVIQETANLEYKDESGALNESFADIFGAMVDRDDWQMGEDIMRQSGTALRDLQNPHNGAPTNNFNAGWQPEKYSERYTGTQDNGGVHFNSGIPNHAFYLFATANGVGKTKAESVFFEALDRYLTRSSRFIDLRLAVVAIAEGRYGQNSTEANAARNAFDQVEILDPNSGGGGGNNPGATPPPGNLQPNPGPYYILSTDVDNFNANTLYRNADPVSQIGHKRKVSVTDNGSMTVMVGDDGYIYIIENVATANPQTFRLQTDPIWQNVVVSKDGNRLAAVTTSIDTSIYIFDLTSNPLRIARGRLYNPTFSSGVNFSGMLYADAMEFDYSGEFLVFDAYNQIPRVNGNDLTFWNIGFMNVWDNASNDFGSGQIELLYGQLDPGDNIGEPAFSKNSPYILAFDYFTQNPNPGDGGYYLLGLNLETDSLKVISNQGKLFVPNYAPLDDAIVFNYEENFQEVVGVLELNPDKISPKTSPTSYVNAAKWGVWLSAGQRSLEPTSIEEEVSALPFTVFPNPAHHSANLSFSLEDAAEVEILIQDLNGREVKRYAPKWMSSGQQQMSISLRDMAAGSYVLKLRAGGLTTMQKLVVW